MPGLTSWKFWAPVAGVFLVALVWVASLYLGAQAGKITAQGQLQDARNENKRLSGEAARVKAQAQNYADALKNPARGKTVDCQGTLTITRSRDGSEVWRCEGRASSSEYSTPIFPPAITPIAPASRLTPDVASGPSWLNLFAGVGVQPNLDPRTAAIGGLTVRVWRGWGIGPWVLFRRVEWPPAACGAVASYSR